MTKFFSFRLLVLGLAVLAVGCGRSASSITLNQLEAELESGDLIFTQSQSTQSEAIRQATGSPWTHVGVVVAEGNRMRILEAGRNGVAFDRLTSFISASRNQVVAICRLKDSARYFTPEAAQKFQASLRQDMGKRYDKLFEWSDQKIYCSELVWRAYQKATGLSVGEVQRVGELKVNQPAVEKLIAERFKLNKAQLSQSALLDEKIITPASMRASPLLKTVFEGIVEL